NLCRKELLGLARRAGRRKSLAMFERELVRRLDYVHRQSEADHSSVENVRANQPTKARSQWMNHRCRSWRRGALRSPQPRFVFGAHLGDQHEICDTSHARIAMTPHISPPDRESLFRLLELAPRQRPEFLI